MLIEVILDYLTYNYQIHLCAMNLHRYDLILPSIPNELKRTLTLPNFSFRFNNLSSSKPLVNF